MASEMKPCPFCGWEGASVVTDCGTSFVRCQDCEARTGSTDTGPIAAIARWNARPAPEYAGLVERLGDAELQRLLKDLTPYREKTIGSLRIDMGEVRKICRAVEVCDEAATALTALTERNKALEAEVERLREAFDEAEDDLCEYFFRSDSAERVRCTICKAEDFTRSSMDHRPGCSVGRLRAALGDRP